VKLAALHRIRKAGLSGLFLCSAVAAAMWSARDLAKRLSSGSAKVEIEAVPD